MKKDNNPIPKTVRRKLHLTSTILAVGIMIIIFAVMSFFDSILGVFYTSLLFIVGVIIIIIGIKKGIIVSKEYDKYYYGTANIQIVNSETTNNNTQHLYCPHCRAIIMEGCKFCPSCGSPIVPTPEDTPTTEQKIERTESEWKEYFKTIIYDSFSNYTIQEDVPVTQLTGDINDVFKLYKDRPNQVYKAEWGRPYDFVLFEGDKVKAVIMLGNGHSHSINVKYLISKMFAKKLKVPYISFYTQFPNKEDYVINRIKEYLGK